jgi:multidrug efflux pump subunit AcrA (membrane-fusion protein)
MRSIALHAGLLAALLFAGGCKKEQPPDAEPQVTVAVKTDALQWGAIDQTVDATGSTSSLREAQLRSPIGGILVSFKFFNGDTVTKGRQIALVRAKEAQAAIEGAQDLLANAATDTQKAEAEKALKMAQESANTVTITAPFTGVLSDKTKNEMEVVGEGDEIADLTDPASIVFLADVPANSAAKIHAGQRADVRFSALSGKVFEGTVRRIESQVNSADQTARVQIAFKDGQTHLSRSMFGDASIIIGQRSHALLAPSKALLHEDETNSTFLMTLGSDSLAHKIGVTVGERKDSLTEILSPKLDAGTVVIVEGQYGLPDSTRVVVAK